MKSKKLGKELPFSKIKSADLTQAEALISGALVCQQTGIISGSTSLRQHPRSFNVLSTKVSDTRHQTVPKTKNVLCVVKLIHTKTVQIKKKESRSAQIVGDPILPIIEAVLHIRTKLLGSTWSKNKFRMPPF